MPGPKPQPRQLKLVKGTLRPGRDLPNQPAPARGLGVPPGHLNEEQVAVWNDVSAEAPPGLLTGLDRGIFEGYCVLLAARTLAVEQYNSTRMAILVISRDDGHQRTIVSPLLKQISRLTEQLRALEGELGFTPAARTRIAMPTGAGVINDPLAKYL